MEESSAPGTRTRLPVFHFADSPSRRSLPDGFEPAPALPLPPPAGPAGLGPARPGQRGDGPAPLLGPGQGPDGGGPERAPGLPGLHADLTGSPGGRTAGHRGHESAPRHPSHRRGHRALAGGTAEPAALSLGGGPGCPGPRRPDQDDGPGGSPSPGGGSADHLGRGEKPALDRGRDLASPRGGGRIPRLPAVERAGI